MKIDNCKLIIEGLLDILLPKKCVGCGREGLYICKDCEVFLSETDVRVSDIHGMSDTPDIVSVWEYEGIIEKAILKIKYDGCYDIINELVEKAFEKIELNLPSDIYITYVPMHKKKERQRGFNQAELIAKKVAKITGSPVGPVLAKIKDNRTQVGLGPQERVENVKGAFRITTDAGMSDIPRMSDIPNILLVDDVYTTGATMRECAKVLRKAGIKNIFGFTVARKLRI